MYNKVTLSKSKKQDKETTWRTYSGYTEKEVRQGEHSTGDSIPVPP